MSDRDLVVEYVAGGRWVGDGPFRTAAFAIVRAIGRQVLGATHVRVVRPSNLDLGQADGLTRAERDDCVAAGLEQ